MKLNTTKPLELRSTHRLRARRWDSSGPATRELHPSGIKVQEEVVCFTIRFRPAVCLSTGVYFRHCVDLVSRPCAASTPRSSCGPLIELKIKRASVWFRAKAAQKNVPASHVSDK